jgi:hypothetical protein
MAQCRQYSQDCGSPGSAAGAPPGGVLPGGFVSAPRATGNRGNPAAPRSKEPNPASALRREVRRASARVEISENMSNQFMV